jgi:heme-degrading monooxygenase HmoA
MPSIAKTPEPPYYAVIFTAQRTEEGRGYEEMAQRMVELAAQQPGFLGVESVRGADGLGITVSYWASEEAIRNWKANLACEGTGRGKEGVVLGLPIESGEGGAGVWEKSRVIVSSALIYIVFIELEATLSLPQKNAYILGVLL